PQHRARSAARYLRERQGERRPRRLRDAVLRVQAALPAADRRLVLDEELDQHRRAGLLPDAQRRLPDVLRLLPVRDAEPAVRRLRLIAVLRQPQLLARAEEPRHERADLRQARHVERLAPRAWIVERRLDARPGIRV